MFISLLEASSTFGINVVPKILKPMVNDHLHIIEGLDASKTWATCKVVAPRGHQTGSEVSKLGEARAWRCLGDSQCGLL